MVFGRKSQLVDVQKDGPAITSPSGTDGLSEKKDDYRYDAESGGRRRSVRRRSRVGIDSDEDSVLDVGKQIELEASNAISSFHLCHPKRDRH